VTTLWSFLLAIAVLVVFHELGHYTVARLCGVKVLRFSVGFGRPLYIKKFPGGDTEWLISLIPLGGYVKMLDEREGCVAPQELSRAFNRQPVLKRMAIIVAGPVANLLLAVLMYWGLFIYGVPGMKPLLGDVPPQTPAAAALLQARETIVSIGGVPMPSWQEVRWALLDQALRGASVHIEGRTAEGVPHGHELDLGSISAADLDSDFLQKLGLQVYQPPVLPVIGRLLEKGVAEQAGLRAGDRVLSVDGHDIGQWKDLVEIVRGHPGSALRLKIERDGGMQEITLTPATVGEGGKETGKIGAAPEIDQKAFDALMTEVRYAPPEALVQALHRTWETAAVSLKMIAKTLFGEVSLKNLSGPISIADYAGQSAKMGAVAYLGFLALISISLGVLNLLPIPLLDGGHLLYYTAELVKGSPVSEKAWDVGQNIGIALLATLMAFALYNDISRLILG
jgi:regulator of sigma E protease